MEEDTERIDLRSCCFLKAFIEVEEMDPEQKKGFLKLLDIVIYS